VVKIEVGVFCLACCAVQYFISFHSLSSSSTVGKKTSLQRIGKKKHEYIFRFRQVSISYRYFSAGTMMRTFLFATASRAVLGHTQPPIQWVLKAANPGVKRRGVKLNIPLRIRMRGALPLLPPYVLMAWCLVKHMGNFKNNTEMCIPHVCMTTS